MFLYSNSMQSVDESYEFVSLEADAAMAGGDRRLDDEHEQERVEHAQSAEQAQRAEQMQHVEHAQRAEHPLEVEPVRTETTDASETVFDYYPPHPLRELGEENGIHYFEDGHFYTEV